MRGRILAALAAACIALPGPAFALFDDDVARKQIQDLRRQVDALSKLVDERLQKVEDRRALIDLATQIESLRSEIARLRGQLEMAQNQVETTDKRGKDLYVDVDTRLRKIEQPREPVAAEKPPAAAAGADAGTAAGELKSYETALNLFKAGNYPLAISAFQVFLYTYPAGKLAPNAQYWMGNTQAAQGQHKLAIATHQKLLATWPEDAKAPDSMAAIANAHEALGDRKSAQKTLETLLARYPQSSAAASARQRLAQGAAKK
jgi:tol-pal system protein YbgF